MNRKRRLQSILLENPLIQTPSYKKRKISYDSYVPEKQKTSISILEFAKNEFEKINKKLEIIHQKVQNIDSRISSIEKKLDTGDSPGKILKFIKEMEQLKIDNTPPKFQEPCPYIF